MVSLPTAFINVVINTRYHAKLMSYNTRDVSIQVKNNLFEFIADKHVKRRFQQQYIDDHLAER